MPRPQSGDLLVEHRDTGNTAPQYDRVGVDKVDHRGQTSGESVGIAPQGRAAVRVSAPGKLRNLKPGQSTPGIAMMIRGERRSREESLDTPRPAAIARRPRGLLRCRPRELVVTPLACDRVRPDDEPPANND